MASLINYKNGRRAVQFVDKDGGRPIVRLGKMPRKAGDVIRMHVDHLVSAALSRQAVPRETAEWLGEIGDDLHRKLARAGLVDAREVRAAVAIGAFLDAYIARRSDLKKMTVNNFKQVRKWMVAHFGADRDLTTITRGEIGDWHRHVKANLSAATVAMHVKKGRQVFQDAVDRRLMAENPVKGLKAGSMENRERLEYVSAETIEAVIAACPDAEWRVVFALARYAGLRVPSETTALRWEDVDWARGRMVVRSSKTEKQGKASRVVPIFPALLPHLREAFDAAPEGARHVVSVHRGENLRTTAFKIIKRAGLEPWGKLFQNLRSSCETDLTKDFPLHVACAWIGNTERVARKHYLQVTDEHFAKALQKALRTGHDTTGQNGNGGGEIAVQTPESQGFSAPGGGRTRGGIPAKYRGLKPEALRKALRRLKKASPSRYRDTMALLRRGGAR